MKLQVDPDAKGAVQKQRKTSLPCTQTKFDKILDKWEQMSIIARRCWKRTNRMVQQNCSHSEDGENIRESLK